MDEMLELKQEFLNEANELLNTMEDGILKLEKDPEHVEAINGIFRVAHTIKGGAASLELKRITEFTHELENLFDKVRDKLIKVDHSMIDIILKSLDILKAMIAAAAKGIEAPEGIELDTLEKIKAAQSQGTAPVKEKKPDVSRKQKEPFLSKNSETIESHIVISEFEKSKLVAAKKAQKNIFLIQVLLNPEYEMRSVSGLQIYTIVKEMGEILASNPSIDEILEEEFVPEIQILLVTDIPEKSVYDKTFISDVTSKVKTEFYRMDEKEEKEVEQQEEKENKNNEELVFSDSVKDSINQHLNSGKNVFKIVVEIEKDNPMRNVDSLLVYNTLEGMGEVLVANPSKTELRTDKFSQFLNLVLATSENKERIKEKCFISGTTKSIKIGVFRSKEKAGEETLAQTAQTKIQQAPETVQKKTEPAKTTMASNSNQQQKSFLRVESSRVDTLMNLVSELVISKAGLIETAQQILGIIDNIRNSGIDTRKLLTENAAKSQEEQNDEKMKKIFDFFNYISKSSWGELDNFENIINIISRVINELQESVMKIRMVPINSLFSRFPRIIRDLSKNLNKKVELEISGEETELDKSVVEELLDPLVHMIRNSIDHGIEIPAERLKLGKSETGRISLRASHEGSMIKIEIEDDGYGLNTEKIKAKAIEKGLVRDNKDLSKEEILHLIFQPGFSTASVVTEVSGRGVGMDVVKKKVENLSGFIFAESEKNKGTKFTIKIPLTLAIIQALIVEINSNSYAIPINNIVETLTITENQLEIFENNQVIRIRDELITVINLRDIFNFKEAKSFKIEERKKEKPQQQKVAAENTPAQDEETANEKYMVIVELSNKKAGFLVDNVVSEQDIVIKPLHKKYAMTKGISGATILGDGRISLIIDISQLIDMYLRKEEYVAVK